MQNKLKEVLLEELPSIRRNSFFMRESKRELQRAGSGDLPLIEVYPKDPTPVVPMDSSSFGIVRSYGLVYRQDSAHLDGGYHAALFDCIKALPKVHSGLRELELDGKKFVRRVTFPQGDEGLSNPRDDKSKLRAWAFELNIEVTYQFSNTLLAQA